MGLDVNYLGQFASASVKTIDELLKVIEQLLDERKDSQAVQELKKHMKDHNGDGINFTYCDDMVSSQFAKALEEKGIPYQLLRDTSNGKPVFVTRDIDEQSVKEAKELVYIRTKQRTEVSFDSLVKSNINPVTNRYEPLKKLPDITPIELAVLREKATENKIVFAKKENDRGTYDIYFNKEDMDKMSNAYIHTKMMLHSELGAVKEAEIMNNLKKNDYVMDYYNRHFNKEDFFIVSAKNPNQVISITNSRIEQFMERENKEPLIRQSFSGDKANIQKGVYRGLQEMKDVVILSKKEYMEMQDQDIQSKKKKLYSLKREQDKEANMETISKESREIAEKQRLAKQLIEMKLLLENQEISTYELNVYDGNISFQEFVRYNNENLIQNEENADKIERMENIADILDDCSPEVREKVYAYLNANQDIIEEYETYESIEDFMPTQDDLSYDIDDYIENLHFETERTVIGEGWEVEVEDDEYEIE